MENESFERALEPQPVKRKRSSILKPADKRVSRDSRTVSFNDRCIYKELHPDGTSDITNLFLQEDMDLTMMDIVEPGDETFNNSVDMSIDKAVSYKSMMEINTSTLNEDQMVTNIFEEKEQLPPPSPSIEDSSSEISSFDNATLANLSSNDTSYETLKGSPVNSSIDLSANETLQDPKTINISINETLYGAFHDSNISVSSNRSSGVDHLVQNIEALDECVQKIDHQAEECVRKLDEEMEELFKWYRHIVNRDNKYEFAIRILGLRYGLWLIIKVDPETYPNQKLSLKFAVNKKDRNLYPFPEYAEAVKRSTKEGRHGYLTKFIFSAQKFRRFLRVNRYALQDKCTNT